MRLWAHSTTVSSAGRGVHPRSRRGFERAGDVGHPDERPRAEEPPAGRFECGHGAEVQGAHVDDLQADPGDAAHPAVEHPPDERRRADVVPGEDWAENGVNRMVLTSAANAASPMSYRTEGVTDETLWTVDDPSLPAYRRSKTIAEKAAWDFMAGPRRPTELTTVLPGLT